MAKQLLFDVGKTTLRRLEYEPGALYGLELGLKPSQELVEIARKYYDVVEVKKTALAF